MATYKVIQDIEAEDKIVGPLTLRQFIYAAISAFLLYLSFFALTKHVGFLLIFFIPPALFIGFLAVPWHGDQPTEIWALAKLRFFVKPRKRIWDQSGAKDLITINVPKKIERSLTNGLSEIEVNSRLHALADTIDSRGWAVKNINVNLSTMPTAYTTSDRLVDSSMLPQEVSSVDVQAADDILDATANPIAHHFDDMITDVSATQREHLLKQMQTQDTPISNPSPLAPPSSPPNDYWFMHQPSPVSGQTTFDSTTVVAPGTAATELPAIPQAAIPSEEEKALIEKFKVANNSQTIANDHLKHIKTPEEIIEEQIEQQKFAAALAAQQTAAQAEQQRKAQVTSADRAAIINLALTNDQDIATLARRAQSEVHKTDDGEVIIPLR